MYTVKKMIALSLAAMLTFSSAAQAASLPEDPEAAPRSSAIQQQDAAANPGLAVQQTADAASPDPESGTGSAKIAAAAPPNTVVAVVGGQKVTTTADSILLNGQQVQPEGYNIGGYNYFKLRDLASLLDGTAAAFNVGWDNDNQSVTVDKGQAYQKVGGELTYTEGEKTVKPSAAKMMIDGKSVNLSAYNINGNNYFKLRDLGDQVGFQVDYDTSKRAILIQSAAAQPAKTYTLSFDMNGQGKQIADLTDVAEGSKVTQPVVQAVQGFSFGGWYQDKDCTKKWDFAQDTVQGDTTLYAQWVESFTVTFNMNGHGKQIADVTGLKPGSKLSKPTDPTETGYTFGGWYTDNDATGVQWNFDKDEVGTSFVLYASWVRDGEELPVPVPTPDEPTLPPADEPVSDFRTDAIDGKMTLLLDAGHGGTDPGCEGGGLDEKHLNLAIANKLQVLLENAGVEVILVRPELETTIKGQDRIAYVEKMMRTYPLDLSVSVHHNAYHGQSMGAEIFVQSPTQDPTGRSKALGNLIMQEYQKIGQVSRGVKNDGTLYMVRVPSTGNVPGILSEFCFLDNATDRAKIDSDEEQQAEAQALFNAIMTYFSIYEY